MVAIAQKRSPAKFRATRRAPRARKFPVATGYEYDAFGNVLREDEDALTQEIGNRFRYQSNWQALKDDTSKRYYLSAARVYDTLTGRFLQKDPIGYRGGFNLYNYCATSPVNNIDPQGLWKINFSNGTATVEKGDTIWSLWKSLRAENAISIEWGAFQEHIRKNNPGIAFNNLQICTTIKWCSNIAPCALSDQTTKIPQIKQPQISIAELYEEISKKDFSVPHLYNVKGMESIIVRRATAYEMSKIKTAGLQATDPSANISMIDHIRGTKPSQYISASTNFLGAYTKTKGGKLIPFDGEILIIETAKVEGEIYSNAEIESAYATKVKAEPECKCLQEKWKGAQSLEAETIIEGRVPPEGLHTKGGYIYRGAGQLLFFYGVSQTAYNMSDAISEAYVTGDNSIIVKQAVRESGGWGGAVAGAYLGAKIGAALGVESGPGLFATGIVGSLVGGTLGYLGADIGINAVE